MKRLRFLLVAGTVFLLISSAGTTAASAETIVLTEDKMLEMALEQNFDILSREEAVKQAAARLEQARSGLLPVVTLGGAYNFYRDHPTVPYSDTLGFTLTLDQVIFAGGGIVNTIAASAKSFQALEFGREEAKNRVVYDARSAFYGALLAGEFVKIRESILGLVEENLSVTEKRYRSGQASHYDVLRSQVEVANMKPELIRAKNNVEVAKNSLRLLLGLEPEQDIELQGELAYAGEGVDANLEAARALETRPALKEAALQGEAARKLVDAARAGRYPQAGFNLTGYANREEAAPGHGRYEDYWVGMVRFSIPLFDGFLTRSRVAEARAALEQAEVFEEQTARGVLTEVENAVLQLRAAEEVISSQQENIGRAEEAYGIMQRRYELGEATQLDVLDARVALMQARVNHAQTVYDAIVAAALLDYVTGRGAVNQRQKYED